MVFGNLLSLGEALATDGSSNGLGDAAPIGLRMDLDDIKCAQKQPQQRSQPHQIWKTGSRTLRNPAENGLRYHLQP